MKRILNYEITKEYAGQPVLFFLKQQGKGMGYFKRKRCAYSDNNRNRLFGKYRSGQASISDCIRR